MAIPAFNAACRSAASASGERQILPRQTNRIDGGVFEVMGLQIIL